MNIIEQLLWSQTDKTLLAANHDIELHRCGNRYWLYTGGEAIQSVFDSENPQRPALEYQQAMLVALSLLPDSPTHILNLGFGIGAFERAFAEQENTIEHWQAVEMDKQVIALILQHLPLKTHWPVLPIDAVTALKTQTHLYDLILCDLFVGQYHHPCIEQANFFHLLRQRLKEGGVVSLNLAPGSEQQITELLIRAKQHFACGVLGKTPPFGNLVLSLSTTNVDKKACTQRAENLQKHWQINFSTILDSMHWL